jgi:hypothetical protein
MSLIENFITTPTVDPLAAFKNLDKLPGVKNAEEFQEISKKLLELGAATIRMNTRILPAIIIPLSIIICYLFIFKNKEQPKRTIFSILLGLLLLGPILWFISMKIANHFYIKKINALNKRILELSK